MGYPIIFPTYYTDDISSCAILRPIAETIWGNVDIGRQKEEGPKNPFSRFCLAKVHRVARLFFLGPLKREETEWAHLRERRGGGSTGPVSYS